MITFLSQSETQLKLFCMEIKTINLTLATLSLLQTSNI